MGPHVGQTKVTLKRSFISYTKGLVMFVIIVHGAVVFFPYDVLDYVRL